MGAAEFHRVAAMRRLEADVWWEGRREPRESRKGREGDVRGTHTHLHPSPHPRRPHLRAHSACHPRAPTLTRGTAAHRCASLPRQGGRLSLLSVLPFSVCLGSGASATYHGRREASRTSAAEHHRRAGPPHRRERGRLKRGRRSGGERGGTSAANTPVSTSNRRLQGMSTTTPSRRHGSRTSCARHQAQIQAHTHTNTRQRLRRGRRCCIGRHGGRRARARRGSRRGHKAVVHGRRRG